MPSYSTSSGALDVGDLLKEEEQILERKRSRKAGRVPIVDDDSEEMDRAERGSLRKLNIDLDKEFGEEEKIVIKPARMDKFLPQKPQQKDKIAVRQLKQDEAVFKPVHKEPREEIRLPQRKPELKKQEIKKIEMKKLEIKKPAPKKQELKVAPKKIEKKEAPERREVPKKELPKREQEKRDWNDPHTPLQHEPSRGWGMKRLLAGVLILLALFVVYEVFANGSNNNSASACASQYVASKGGVLLNPLENVDVKDALALKDAQGAITSLELFREEGKAMYIAISGPAEEGSVASQLYQQESVPGFTLAYKTENPLVLTYRVG